MSITFMQAEAALASGQYKTVDSLLELVKTVSGGVMNAGSNATYLLYSGAGAQGGYASSIVHQVGDAGGGLHRTNSEVGKFAYSVGSSGSPFNNVLRMAIKAEMLGDPFGVATTEQSVEMTRRFTEFVHGKTLDGNRINYSSLWDVASKKFGDRGSGL